MNREVHVRFCERFRGETPLYLLDLLSVEVVKSLSAVSFGVVVELRLGLFVSAVGSGFKNFRREGNLKK